MAKKTDNKINKAIKEKVLRFGRVLEQQGIPVNKLVIFGSHAKNKATRHSDIDVCVVSSKFGKDNLGEMQFLFKQTSKVDAKIEPIPASPKEYNQLESPLMWEIRKYGREIKI